jgi:Lrp/AsnC family transcriptional regulator for asnA, asnC and gidA
MIESSDPPPLQLDELDVALISLLQEDGRAPLTELGERLGVSHGTVRNRLDRLLAGQVIRIAATVDPTSVGYPNQVFIGISADLQHMAEIEKQLTALEEVTFVSTITGRLDIMIGAALVSNSHLREFLFQKLSQIRGVRSTETFHTLSQVKRVWHWKIPMASGRRQVGSRK